ncbi:MAG: hypothetical protein WKF60_10995, partial [Ilumatobacter sp.]
MSEPGPADESTVAAAYTWNMTTRHADVFGRQGRYLMTAADEMAAIERFVRHAPTAGSTVDRRVHAHAATKRNRVRV